MQKFTGLTASQIQESLQKYGGNKLPEEVKTTKLEILLNQFLSPLIFVLLIASLLTFFLGEYLDTIAIIIVTLVNTLLGFFQENRAQNALQSLKKIIKPQVTVIRGGQTQIVSGEDLVVGDIVRLKSGERIPADGVLLDTSSFTVSEAILTGESAPIEKHANDADSPDPKFNQVFMGTVALSGYAVMQVTAVGSNTSFGKIAQNLSKKDEEVTPLQKKLGHFSKQIAVIVVVLSLILFILGYAFGDPENYVRAHAETIGESSKLVGLITLCVSLAISAIPEGLVISLTVVLTLSMQRLLRRKALVRKLVVAETLGSVTTICVDKTGTLTEGNMHVVDTKFTDPDLAKYTLLEVNRDLNAVDSAITAWLTDHGVNTVRDLTGQPHLFDIPFNSKYKFAASIHQDAIYIVGAPDILLTQSQLTDADKADWKEHIEQGAAKGNRIVAVATAVNTKYLNKSEIRNNESEILHNLTWLGTVTIEDPVRKDVLPAFKLLTEAGIKLKVITGDQKITAMNIMDQVGIRVSEDEILSGEQLDTLSDKELQQLLPKVLLFYRTVPEQKLRIVDLLQANNEIVGMMGDGINDAPALRTADVGIAVENATEVSKETADIVLLDNNISTIAAAVEEGRTIFENLRKIVTYLLSDGTAEVFLILGSLLFRLPLPLLPLQILYINLIADGLPATALAFEPPEKNLMQDKPRPINSQIMDRQMLTLIGIVGGVVNFGIFAVYIFLLSMNMPINEIRSFIYVMMAVDSLIYVYSMRSLRTTIWSRNIFSNSVLNLAVISGFLLVLVSFHIPFIASALELSPLTFAQVALVSMFGFFKVFIIEIFKHYTVVKAAR